MLSGEYPYRLADPPNFLLAHITGAPIPLVTRVGDVPEDLEQLVHRLLAKDPADRIDSADAVVERLRTGGEVSGSGERRLRASAARLVPRWACWPHSSAPASCSAATAATCPRAWTRGGRSSSASSTTPSRSRSLTGFASAAWTCWHRPWAAGAISPWWTPSACSTSRVAWTWIPKARLSQEDDALAREAGV
jgi:hypothetical protein